jgi:hypothetical protein
VLYNFLMSSPAISKSPWLNCVQRFMNRPISQSDKGKWDKLSAFSMAVAGCNICQTHALIGMPCERMYDTIVVYFHYKRKPGFFHLHYKKGGLKKTRKIRQRLHDEPHWECVSGYQPQPLWLRQCINEMTISDTESKCILSDSVSVHNDKTVYHHRSINPVCETITPRVFQNIVSHAQQCIGYSARKTIP